MASYKLFLPKMGESVAEATIIKWVKRPGDYVHIYEPVMEIATDKVDSDVPSPVSGKLISQFYRENDVVQVGSLIAIIETGEPEEATHYQQPETYNTPTNYEQPKPETPQVPYVDQIDQRTSFNAGQDTNQQRFYSPLVKNIVSNEGLSQKELVHIPGSGADGRLTKDDVLNYIRNKNNKPDTQPAPIQAPVETPVYSAPQVEKPEPAVQSYHTPPAETPQVVPEEPKTAPVHESAAPEIVWEKPEIEQPKATTEDELPQPEAVTSSLVSPGDEIIEMDRMRRLISEHMVMSKQVSAHVTSFVEADVTNLVHWRDRVKDSFEKREGEKVTFTPIFIEALVRSIKDFPMINISVDGNQIIKKKDINIGMATALPNGNLIVPVIKKADGLSLTGLTKEVNDLANRARNNKLKPDDVQGGTFTITNVGSFGNVMGTPIINQPQVAVLAIGVIRKKPAVIETLQGDMIGIRHMMFLSLSYDHRVVDGALGGSFVKRVADYLENWDTDREI